MKWRHVLFLSLFLVTLQAGGNLFDGLEVKDVSDSEVPRDANSMSEITDEFKFRAFGDLWDSDKKVYSYDKYYKGITPDVAVRIGSETVRKWSYRFLGKEGLPVYYVRYGIVGDSLDISVTLDHSYFKKRAQVDLVAPSWAPGEIFKEPAKREGYTQSSTDERFVFDIRFRVRFPLIGYTNPESKGGDNTVYMEFARQAIHCYYFKDFETFLEKSEKKLRMKNQIYDSDLSGGIGQGNSPEKRMEMATAELDRLMKKLEKEGDLSEEEMRRLEQVEKFLDGKETGEDARVKLRELSREIENFKSGSLMPVVPSATAVRELLLALAKEKTFAAYLDVEVVDYNDQAGGVVRVGGLNRVIEANLPGLDVYFVGIDRVAKGKEHLFGKEPSKIFVAGRLRNAR